MKFSLEEKIQILKWYFSGNSLQDTINAFIENFENHSKPSKMSIRYVAHVFDKNGCLHNYCKKCSGSVYKPSKMTDEAELNEIMICAAAELELSIRYIAIELEMSKSTVFNILKKNGYSTASVIEKSVPTMLQNENITEKLSDKKKQIIKWYCQKETLLKMIQLFIDNFKCNNNAKEEIFNAIMLFEMHGCLRNCKKCMENINKTKQNLKIYTVEELISERSRELGININSDKIKIEQLPSNENLVSEPVNKKIKLECSVQMSSKSVSSDNITETCHTNLIGKEEIVKITVKEENSVEKKHSFEQNIEFVSVEPTLNIVVEEKNSKNRKRRKKV